VPGKHVFAHRCEAVSIKPETRFNSIISLIMDDNDKLQHMELTLKSDDPVVK